MYCMDASSLWQILASAVALLSADAELSVETWSNLLEDATLFRFREFCQVLLQIISCVAMKADQSAAEQFLTDLVKVESVRFSRQLDPLPKHGGGFFNGTDESQCWPMDALTRWKSGPSQSLIAVSAPPSPIRSTLSRSRSRRSSLVTQTSVTASASASPAPKAPHGALAQTLLAAAAAAADQSHSDANSSASNSPTPNLQQQAAAERESSCDRRASTSDSSAPLRLALPASLMADISRHYRSEFLDVQVPLHASAIVLDFAQACSRSVRWGGMKTSQTTTHSGAQVQTTSSVGNDTSTNGIKISGSEEQAESEADQDVPAGHAGAVHAEALNQAIEIGAANEICEKSGAQQADEPTQMKEPCEETPTQPPSLPAKNNGSTSQNSSSASTAQKVLERDEYTNIDIPYSIRNHQRRSGDARSFALANSMASFGRTSLKSQYITTTARAIQNDAEQKKQQLQKRVHLDHQGLFLGANKQSRRHESATRRTPRRDTGRTSLTDTARHLLDSTSATVHSNLLSVSQMIIDKGNPRMCYSKVDSLQLIPPQSPPGSPYTSEILRLFVEETGNQGRRVLDTCGALDLESSKVLLQPSPFSDDTESGGRSGMPNLPVRPASPSLAEARTASMKPWSALKSFAESEGTSISMIERSSIRSTKPFGWLQSDEAKPENSHS